MPKPDHPFDPRGIGDTRCKHCMFAIGAHSSVSDSLPNSPEEKDPVAFVVDALQAYADKHNNPQALYFAAWIHSGDYLAYLTTKENTHGA